MQDETPPFLHYFFVSPSSLRGGEANEATSSLRGGEADVATSSLRGVHEVSDVATSSLRGGEADEATSSLRGVKRRGNPLEHALG
jgi:hypothetical protein